MAKHTPSIGETEAIDLAALARESYLVSDATSLSPDEYPEVGSLSPRHFYRFLPIPNEPEPCPEYVYVRSPEACGLSDDAYHKYRLFLSTWNNTWEAGRERPGFLDRDVPEQLQWVIEKGTDIRLVWRGGGKSYDPYGALYHLLPRSTLERFGLPLLRRGLWPQLIDHHLLEHILPSDFDLRFEEAFTYHLWPLLGARGAPSCFSSDEPVRMLSHNLDFWMPYVDIVAQGRARALRRTEFEDKKQEADYYHHKDEMPPGVSLQTPLCGGSLWFGVDDALDATHEVIEIADEHGNLRAILDEIRSHRIRDDFSERWSFEREDFERKLYSKRNKTRITFVELDDTIPVHGPQSEAHENLLWADLFALLDPNERRVVVCLRNGVTRMGDISKILGYANHSPISKKLARIRQKAKILLGTD